MKTWTDVAWGLVSRINQARPGQRGYYLPVNAAGVIGVVRRNRGRVPDGDMAFRILPIIQGDIPGVVERWARLLEGHFGRPRPNPHEPS